METENKDIENFLSVIEKLHPNQSSQIATLAFVNWHNILNHASLESLDDRHVLYAVCLILQLAKSNFNVKNETITTITNQIQKSSFEDSIDFLSELDKNEEDSDK